MEYLLKQGEPGLRQDLLIYNADYSVYRDGESLGIATFCDDDVHGDVFLKITESEHGKRAEVFIVDEWILHKQYDRPNHRN